MPHAPLPAPSRRNEVGDAEHVGHTRGAEEARALEAQWRGAKGKVDAARYDVVRRKLRRQADDAAAWSAHCLRYFQGFSGRELPGGP